jgi:hypothetical protein
LARTIQAASDALSEQKNLIKWLDLPADGKAFLKAMVGLPIWGDLSRAAVDAARALVIGSHYGPYSGEWQKPVQSCIWSPQEQGYRAGATP